VSNVPNALRMVEGIPNGTVDPALLHPDFRAWTLTLGDLAGDAYLGALARLAALFEPPLHVEVVGVTDGGDRVAIEARSQGTLPDGSTYRNNYAFFFAFADGQILEIREYLDVSAIGVIRAFQAARDTQSQTHGAAR
jgi:ketosteroid isomerase-like protein